MRRTVLYILSTNYAGSHFLALQLASHSRAFHLGEIHHRARPGKEHRNICHVCEPLETCPLRRGITPENADGIHARIFSNLEEDGADRVDVLIDNSKTPRWCARFVDDPDHRQVYVHLVRDPRALVRRWTVNYATPRERRRQRWKAMRRDPRRALRTLFSPDWHIYVRKWEQKNAEISRFLEPPDRRAASLVVTYRDLARDPEAELRRILEWVGLEEEPGLTDYWNFEHHGSQKPDYEWIKKGKERYFDLRWQEDLQAEVLRGVEADAGVQRYLASIGLRMESDGLARLRG